MFDLSLLSGNRRRPNNTPLSAGKGTLYEGGIRVPLIIAGPGIQTGYCEEPVSGIDLFSTFASWAGAVAGGNESADLTPLLTGRPGQFKQDRILLFHYPHYGQGPQVPQTALVSGHWKLLRDWDAGTDTLYNLKSDPGEQQDRSSAEPETFRKMTALMDQRLTETGAQLPAPNPDYDPDSEPQRGRRASRNRS